MKVLIITDLCRGNAVTLPERFLFRGMKAKGVDLTVITHWETPESKDAEASGVKVIYLPLLKKIDLKAIRKLRNLIREEKFDIIHLTFGKAITNSLFATRGIGIKFIAYIGSLNVHWHDPFAHLSFLSRRIDKLICLSDGVLDHIVKQAPFRLKNRVVRIYKGYDPGWIKGFKTISRASLNIPEDAMVITCVAIVRKVKGIPYLIRAADHLPEKLPIYFVMVGKDMDSPYLAEMINRSKYRDNFRVFGFTNDVFSYTSMCDLYVQPSVTEGLGRSIIEAMCLEKPVLVTEKGGSKELVEEGVNGFVVKAKSPSAIAEKILHSYNNRTLLPGMGKKSKEIILNKFSPQIMTDQTYNLYCEVLK